MKKNILLALLVSCTLCGCGKVSQSEYDALLHENEKLSTELENLQSEEEQLSTELENLRTEHINSISDGLPLVYAEAWAHSAFNESAECFVSENQLITIVPTEYDYSSESLSALFKQFRDAVKSYSLSSSLFTSESYSFDPITVIFQGKDGEYILLLSFNIDEDGQFHLKEPVGNLMHASDIIKAFSSSNW